MEIRCKFCGERITTSHYIITKSGSVCLSCRDKTRNLLRNCGVVVKEGEEDADRRRVSFGFGEQPC